MTIDIRRNRLVGSGVYADVFAVANRAYKLFKSGPEIPPRQTKEGRRRIFNWQCEAFRIAAGDPWLGRHIAQFHGVCLISDVIDSTGVSVRSSYLLDCCYVMELFGPGENDSKVTAEWVEGHDHIVKARRQFNELGISTHDSSVFEHGDPEWFKFIDIEMRDCY